MTTQVKKIVDLLTGNVDWFGGGALHRNNASNILSRGNGSSG
jgi:hypothetical protein